MKQDAGSVGVVLVPGCVVEDGVAELEEGMGADGGWGADLNEIRGIGRTEVEPKLGAMVDFTRSSRCKFDAGRMKTS